MKSGNQHQDEATESKKYNASMKAPGSPNIEKESGYSIDFEIKEVKRHLHEIYTWKKGDKSTIEFIRMEFLKQLASLYREKRMNGLSFWKDNVFEKRDRRNLVFEYKELTWMDGLAFENSKQRKVRT